MKVLFLITRPERGGAQVHVVDLIRGLRNRCEIEVAAGEDEDHYLFEEAEKLGVRWHLLPSLRQPMDAVSDARAFIEIMALLRRRRPDLIHAHTSKAGILGRFAASFRRIPAVFTAHTWCFTDGTSWKWKVMGLPLERLASSARGLIINVSEANRQLALQYKIATPERLVTIHNCIPDEPWAGPPATAGPPTVVMVARFVPQKQHTMLLKAAAGVQQPFRLLFVGTGATLAEVREMARELGLEDRVTFTGDRSDVPDLLRQSSIFVLPSRWEGFPISILEAMRAGLPVIAADVGGVREAVIDGENGFLIGHADTAGLQRALETLLSDARLRDRMAHCSRALFEQRFTAEHMLEKTFGIYRMAFPETREGYGLSTLRSGEHA